MCFEELVIKVSPVLKRIVYRIRVRYPFLGEDDLFQEALIHLWSDFQNGILDDKTDSYILQGCYFYLKNYLRKVKDKNRLISIEMLLGDGQGEQLPHDNLLLLHDERNGDGRSELNDRLLAETILNNGLTSREKYLLRLCSEGLTTRQMGQRLGISHVGVVKMLARIREKSRKYLDSSK